MSLTLLEQRFKVLEAKEKAHKSRFQKKKTATDESPKVFEGNQSQVLRLRGYDDNGKTLFHRFFSVDEEDMPTAKTSSTQSKAPNPRPSTAPSKLKSTVNRPTSAVPTASHRTRPSSAFTTISMQSEIAPSTIYNLPSNRSGFTNAFTDDLESVEPIQTDRSFPDSKDETMLTLSPEPVRKIGAFSRQISQLMDSSMLDVSNQVEYRISQSRGRTPELDQDPYAEQENAPGLDKADRNLKERTHDKSSNSSRTVLPTGRSTNTPKKSESASEAWGTTRSKSSVRNDTSRLTQYSSYSMSSSSIPVKNLSFGNIGDDFLTVRSGQSSASSRVYLRDVPASIRRSRTLSSSLRRLDVISQGINTSKQSETSNIEVSQDYEQEDLQWQQPSFGSFDVAIKINDDEIVGNIIEIHIQDKIAKQSFIRSSGSVDKNHFVIIRPPEDINIQPLKEFEWIKSKADLQKKTLYYKLYDLTFGRDLLSRGKLLFCNSVRSKENSQPAGAQRIQIVSLSGDVSIIPFIDLPQ